MTQQSTLTEAATDSVPDGTRRPWAQDLDGTWHRRPANDEWGDHREVVQAHGICGMAFASVHCSEIDPPAFFRREGDERLCSQCGFVADQKPEPAT